MYRYGVSPRESSGITRKGFTLIELLVVIAIIGLLASVVIASLSSARAKGRDARRVQDLRQIANQINLYDSGGVASGFGGCNSSGVKVNTCSSPDLSKYSDPLSGGAVCAAAGSVPCDYTIGKTSVGVSANSPTTQSWVVCAYLEKGSGTLSTGMIHMAYGTSSISQTCY